MDSYEATKMVFSRIQTLDPENASKIMGYIFIQDLGEKELIRLALGPDPLLHQLILKAKSHLCLPISSPNHSSSPCNPISRPNPLRVSNNVFYPSSPSSNPWPLSPISPPSSLSYASIVNGTSVNSVSSPLSSTFPYFKNTNSTTDFVDDYQLQDHLSFLNDAKNDELFDLGLNQASYGGGDGNMHHRSYSVPGLFLGPEDINSSGFGWKPCLYFARGFCKNGSSCRFSHGGSVDAATAIVGSPSKLTEFEQCKELLRSKSIEQHKQTVMAAGGSFPYNKCMNFLTNHNDAQRSAAALMNADELPEFGRCRSERIDFSALGMGGMMNPGSRQIYLTFTAESTFREEDVSNYFSIYGPVQDVRIPYQQKRMFGFVTFVYPETVKLILAKGNPHFVCDSRVLVKPYKEKGKIPERKQHHHNQQLDMGEYSSCLSPSGLDSREPFDLSFGARMLYNTQEMLLRRKLEEQADLQQVIDFQGRRLMNLQLLDLKNQHNLHFHPSLPIGSPTASPTLSHNRKAKSNEFAEAGSNGIPPAVISQDASVDVNDNQQLQKKEINSVNINGNDFSKDDVTDPETSDLLESLEHILPNSLNISPEKSTDTSPFIPSMSTLNMASLESSFLQLPRLSSGLETIM